MQPILRFWSFFVLLFFSVVISGYYLRVQPEIVMILLFLLYGFFLAIALWRGIQLNNKWLYSAIVFQLLFSVLAPLYFSNFGDPVYEFATGEWFGTANALEPCQLCWWARIILFPLLPLSIMAFFTRSRHILWYIYGASIAGMLLEVYHYVLQKFAIPNPFGCTAANPCSALDVQYFGFITIPLLCLFSFIAVHIFVSCILFSKKLEKNK